ncbi:hypothetical protein EVJ58_g2973, partial [Rhodofomes roseus]
VQDSKTATFTALSEIAGDQVREWEKMEAESATLAAQDEGKRPGTSKSKRKKGKAKAKKGLKATKNRVESVYLLNEDIVPRAGKVYEELAKQEIEPAGNFSAAAAHSVPRGTVNYFRKGMDLEKRQYELRTNLKKNKRSTSDDDEDGASMAGTKATRRTLRRELDKWRELQVSLMPEIDFPDADGELDDDDDDDDDDDTTTGTPEDEPLALPSDFTATERDDLGLQALATIERRIRVGHAYDLLDGIKQSLNHQGAFLLDKRKHARGQKDNTRSQTQVNAAVARTRAIAGLYNYNRDRLIALSCDDSDVLPQLNLDSDLKGKNWNKPRQLGDSRDEASWIWTVVPPWRSEGQAEAWQLEVDRVQWFRAKAEMTRANEEVNKLHAEFKRTILGFKNMSKAWEAVSAKDLSRGAQVYARKKADMFSKMSLQCANAFASTRRDYQEKWDYAKNIEDATNDRLKAAPGATIRDSFESKVERGQLGWAPERPVRAEGPEGGQQRQADLMRSSFEETVEILMEAAVVGERDDCHGIAENVIFGQMAPMGTGAFDVALDIDMLKDVIVDHRLPVETVMAAQVGAGMTPGQVAMMPYDTNSPMRNTDVSFKGEAATFSPLAVNGGEEPANFSYIGFGQSPVAILRPSSWTDFAYVLADAASTQPHVSGILADEPSLFTDFTVILPHVASPIVQPGFTMILSDISCSN